MEPDSRGKSKHSRMKAFKKSHYQNLSQTSKNMKPSRGLVPPSPGPATIRGVIDVADSSDDRFTYRSSQWSEEHSDDDDDEHLHNEQMTAGDFSLMQNIPAQGSGHFVFSSEKNWDNDDTEIFDNSETSSYFTINLKLLNAGLNTIPFYKRMDFPVIFEKHEIKLMNLEAENAEKQFQEILKKHEQNMKNKSNITNSRIGSGKSSQKSEKKYPISPPTPTAGKSDNEKNSKSLPQKDDDLNELLSLTTNNVAKVSFQDNEAAAAAATAPILTNPEPVLETNVDTSAESAQQTKTIEIGNKEDIQQWLDDILE